MARSVAVVQWNVVLRQPLQESLVAFLVEVASPERVNTHGAVEATGVVQFLGHASADTAHILRATGIPTCPKADETDASPEKFDILRRNPVQLSMWMNGRCERFIETIKLECLRKFIIFGKRHLDHLVSEFVDYYNHRRSHMEREHLPPVRQEPEEAATVTMDQVEVKEYVGGLVKSFERKAA